MIKSTKRFSYMHVYSTSLILFINNIYGDHNSIECALVYFFMFLFYIPHTRSITSGGLAAFNPTQIFKINKILKRYIINTLSCVNAVSFKLGFKHYVKSIRIRSYSGPDFSRIFPHSGWILRDTPYIFRHFSKHRNSILSILNYL